jgi:hypothetical protein
VFFLEEEGVTIVEKAVAGNVGIFEAKFKGFVPLPRRFAPQWAVALKGDSVDVGGTIVEVCICRPAIAVSNSLPEAATNVLSTLEPSRFSKGESFTFTVSGASSTLIEGKDFWLSAGAMVRSTKAVDWLQ